MDHRYVKRLHPTRHYGWITASALACVIGVAAPPVHAQPAAHRTTAQRSADHQAVRNYPLTENLLQRMQAVKAAAEARHLQGGQGSSDPADLGSLDAMTQALVREHPQVVPLLASHGFTPRSYVTAQMALMSASMAATALANPDSSIARAIQQQHDYNPSQVAFVKAHAAEIRTLMQGGAGSSR